MRRYSYIAVAFVILVFGIIFIPRIIDRFQQSSLVDSNRLSAPMPLSFIELNGEAKRVPDFVFTNQDERLISNEDYLGKVYVIEFFFTTCPTICPVMNANMKRLEAAFGNRDDFGIASFTIDPEKDTPEQLKRYAENLGVFSQNWHFLTGKAETIYELANTGFNIFAGINPNVAGGFEHQGYFALVDQNGYLRSRTDRFGNPIVYYLGIPESELDIQGTDMLLEDVLKLLENE
ncbi:MAG: SCO1 protein [Flavobacteriales bacterium]|jgi:protein SCO1/2|nr:MAG: SCO family protein [Flavobacteriales bacterium]CAI8261743.1 MAG: SCO1 protein [Flavobacteriales bacterium]|tara:strand:+ start:3137 stop:3835 length:699 start_codon:yes stop_codon:yes gene_type:complete